MKFNWEKILKPNVAIQCPERWQFILLQNASDDEDKNINYWDDYRENTCFYSSKKHYYEYIGKHNMWDDYTILTFEEVVMEEFEFGEKVEVSEDGCNFKKARYLFEAKSRYHCLRTERDIQSFECTGSYIVYPMRYIRKLKPKIEVKATINGKEATIEELKEAIKLIEKGE